jgi:hypothetical protein
MTQDLGHFPRLCLPGPPSVLPFLSGGSGSCFRLAGAGAGAGAELIMYDVLCWTGHGGGGAGLGGERRMLAARRRAQSWDCGINSGGTPRPTSSPTSSADTRRPCNRPLILHPCSAIPCPLRSLHAAPFERPH